MAEGFDSNSGLSMDHISVFHPFAKMEWKKVGDPVPHVSSISPPNCVCLGDRVYTVATERGSFDTILYSFSLDFKEYKRLSLPVRSYALSHYHSQLVLVGKCDADDDPSDLWVCGDDGVTWRRSLPPLKIRRAGVSVVNTGSPEYLVVIGGNTRHCDSMNAVEVLVDGEWFIAEHLPYGVRFPLSYVHNGMLIAVSRFDSYSYCCSVTSLLATCRKSLDEDSSSHLQQETKALSPPHLAMQGNVLSVSHFNSRNIERFSVWKEFPKLRKQFRAMFTFQQQLIAIHRDIVEMFCPFTHKWLKIGEVPGSPEFTQYQQGTSITCGVLSNGDVVLMGQAKGLEVYSASLRLSPDTDLSESALHRLNMVGFQLYLTLADLYWEFIEAVGIPDVRDKTSPEKTMANVFEKWLAKENVRRPPTWKSLLDILTELGLGDLSEQISSYLANGVIPLKDQCMGVVISALLQQGMELDQLSTRFPYYIPTSLQNSIMSSFTACTLQLIPFKSLPFMPCGSGRDSDSSFNTQNSTSPPFVSTVLPPYQEKKRKIIRKVRMGGLGLQPSTAQSPSTGGQSQSPSTGGQSQSLSSGGGLGQLSTGGGLLLSQSLSGGGLGQFPSWGGQGQLSTGGGLLQSQSVSGGGLGQLQPLSTGGGLGQLSTGGGLLQSQSLSGGGLGQLQPLSTGGGLGQLSTGGGLLQSQSLSGGGLGQLQPLSTGGGLGQLSTGGGLLQSQSLSGGGLGQLQPLSSGVGLGLPSSGGGLLQSQSLSGGGLVQSQPLPSGGGLGQLSTGGHLLQSQSLSGGGLVQSFSTSGGLLQSSSTGGNLELSPSIGGSLGLSQSPSAAGQASPLSSQGLDHGIMPTPPSLASCQGLEMALASPELLQQKVFITPSSTIGERSSSPTQSAIEEDKEVKPTLGGLSSSVFAPQKPLSLSSHLLALSSSTVPTTQVISTTPPSQSQLHTLPPGTLSQYQLQGAIPSTLSPAPFPEISPSTHSLTSASQTPSSQQPLIPPSLASASQTPSSQPLLPPSVSSASQTPSSQPLIPPSL